MATDYLHLDTYSASTCLSSGELQAFDKQAQLRLDDSLHQSDCQATTSRLLYYLTHLKVANNSIGSTEDSAPFTLDPPAP